MPIRDIIVTDNTTREGIIAQAKANGATDEQAERTADIIEEYRAELREKAKAKEERDPHDRL